MHKTLDWKKKPENIKFKKMRESYLKRRQQVEHVTALWRRMTIGTEPFIMETTS